MSNELKEIKSRLLQHASPEARMAHEKFVPGKERIIGVRTPVLNQLAREYQMGGFALVERLWKAGSLEEKILAGKMLGRIAKKDPERALRLVERFSETIGNWAVCDTIGMQSLKPIVLTHEREIFGLAGRLNGSEDFWQRRLSLVLVEWYTRYKRLLPAIKKLVKGVENDEEYYVRKAVMWVRKNLEKGK